MFWGERWQHPVVSTTQKNTFLSVADDRSTGLRPRRE
jgi:hypothetical protein